MALPDFQAMMRPVLVSLTTDEAISIPQIRARVAEDLGVSDEEQQILLPSGKQATFSNRVAWALFHMGKAGLAEHPARGQYIITKRGR
jgi:restriction system protein